MLNFNMKIKVLFLLPLFLMLFRCANDNDSTPETLKNVTYEVLIFEYTLTQVIIHLAFIMK
jgi:hypothetical protein